MKYDFTKCNNLNFKIKDGTTGYIKVVKNPFRFYLYFDKDKNLGFDTELQLPTDTLGVVFESLTAFEKWAEATNLEIIPRDSNTYTDWKTGDTIQNKVNQIKTAITVKLGPIFYIGERFLIYSANEIKGDFKLVLTDYEKELSETIEEKVIPFEEGDRVLVRSFNYETWKFDIFMNYKKDEKYPYCCIHDEYALCIPFNEKTWQLLGTTDDYKEK